MFKYLYFGLLGVTILQLSSCVCNKVDCVGEVGVLTFNVFKNNKNAVFGPNSIYDKTQIEVASENEFVFIDFKVDTVNENLSLTIVGGISYFLKLDSITVDTLVADFHIIKKHRCCSEFGIRELKYNNEAVCVEDCQGEIRVDL